jgi:quercetin dioxygenase-like cupin family protein
MKPMSNEAFDGLRKRLDEFRWAGVERVPYKEEGSALFKSISRQVLFSDPRLSGEVRYFEIAAGGYSTLERHGHVHFVMILRGAGACLVGAAVRALATQDLITIPPWTWHQFRATAGETLGFLCLVNAERDRPQLPGDADIAALRANPEVADFLDGRHKAAV